MLGKIKFPSTGYSDVRLEETFETNIRYRNRQLLLGQEVRDKGVFLRHYHQGKWFSESTSQIDQISEKLQQLSLEASELKGGNDKLLPKREPQSFHERRYQSINSSQISLKDKKDFCLKIHEILDRYAEVKDVVIHYRDVYKIKYFQASDQVDFSFDYHHAGMSISVALQRGEKVFNDRIRLFFHDLNAESTTLLSQVEEEIRESILFLDAETVQPGYYPVILSPEITGVFTHESFGHKSEADFIIGDKVALEEWKLGSKIASELVSIVDDGGFFQSSGYCPMDDEGERKKKTYLIKNGILVGRLHSRETAIEIGEENTGNARAMSYEYEPIVRMTSTYIEPGPHSLEEMISSIQYGFYIKSFLHGSGLSQFTIAPIKSYLIENGKISRPVRVSVITGSVRETLNDIKMVSHNFELVSGAIGGCGKNDQWPLPVADGGPSILVSKMQVS